MSLISRLFGTRPDPREAVRPLWHRVVEVSRQAHWYADEGVADSVAGRFDMITAVLSLVLIRMEQEEALIAPSALLTELFVEDMEGQLRQSGVGDAVVGKRMGRLMGVLGGRLGAYRDGLTQDGNAALVEAVRRNVTLQDGKRPEALAERLRAYSRQLAVMDGTAILSAQLPERIEL
ncbi:ubiquinol-cytochrome C chaperone family protein [Altericroceibacterium xinjiangense]|uniref:ubiquinol-cytochrome C chaperone family protein n=1 Tax=Altericroceibacterium xinjiangense TaxID=762261 RepID=UPI000F7DC2A8|nr:ubiquinol-cytochrome C chaperone family protein [Altericroceibacterium xinjiangense]